MSDVHHRQPALRVALAQADLLAHGGGEDLAAAAGERVKAGVLEAHHDPANLLLERRAGRVEEVDELHHLGRAEGVDVDPWELLFDRAQQFEIPVEREGGVHAALHQDLRAADGLQLGDLLVDLLVAERVRVGIALVALEGTEGALGVADVGVVDVAVDDVRANAIAVDAASGRVSVTAERVSAAMTQHLDALIRREAGFARGDGGEEAGVGA
ncbi:MAG: hypothetical protein QM783_11635 [Phycisphaerales bacterium]